MVIMLIVIKCSNQSIKIFHKKVISIYYVHSVAVLNHSFENDAHKADQNIFFSVDNIS